MEPTLVVDFSPRLVSNSNRDSQNCLYSGQRRSFSLIDIMAQTVFGGMSGGVDGSVTAGLLLNQGYRVVGVFMKNWTSDVAGFACPWRADLTDAQSVAAKLGVQLKIYDFQKDYRQKVV